MFRRINNNFDKFIVVALIFQNLFIFKGSVKDVSSPLCGIIYIRISMKLDKNKVLLKSIAVLVRKVVRF